MSDEGHRYTVELRVYGRTLNPDVITKETGLTPRLARRAGDRLGSRTFKEGTWGFDGALRYDWESLEVALSDVLDLVEPHRETFARYAQEYSLVWWCGHFQSAFDGGPTLSVAMLARLAAFPAELFIDNYFSRSNHADE